MQQLQEAIISFWNNIENVLQPFLKNLDPSLLQNIILGILDGNIIWNKDMQLLKTINPDKIAENSIQDWQYRKAARAVVFDKDNKIGLLHVSNKNYYKLPGGGIEAGEDIKIALDRECEEELGVQIEVSNEIGSIVEYRTQYKLHQTSYCFTAKVCSGKNTPNFTEEEKSSGFEIVWVEPKDALNLLSLKQTTDYEGKFIEERDFLFLNKALEATKEV